MCKGYGGDLTQNSRRKIPGLSFQAKRNEGGEHTVEVFLKFFGSLYWKKKFYDGEWTEGLIILKLVLLHQAPSCTLSPRGSVNQPGAVPSPHTLGISVLHPYNKKLLLLVGSRAEASGRTKQYTQVNSEWIKPLLFLFIDPLNVACPPEAIRQTALCSWMSQWLQGHALMGKGLNPTCFGFVRGGYKKLPCFRKVSFSFFPFQNSYQDINYSMSSSEGS